MALNLKNGEVEGLVKELGVAVVAFGEPEWHAAVNAFLRFGRGRHTASEKGSDPFSAP